VRAKGLIVLVMATFLLNARGVHKHDLSANPRIFTNDEFAHATPSPELDASPGSGSSAQCPTQTPEF
jgi:hypothetical protein